MILWVICLLVLRIHNAASRVIASDAGFSTTAQHLRSRSTSGDNSTFIKTKFTNTTSDFDDYRNEQLEITCFRTSPELPLKRATIVDCAKIIRDLAGTVAPDADLNWGTGTSKNPDYIVPYTLPPHGSCTANVEPWPPDSTYASDKFSTNYLAFVVKEIILGCLTGSEPYGGSTVFGPQKRMRLTVSGPLPVRGGGKQYASAGLVGTVSESTQTDVVEIS